MTANDGTQSHTVLTAKGVVAYKGVETTIVFVGEVFLAYYIQCHVKIAYTLFKPFNSFLVTTLPKKLVIQVW